MNLNDFVVLPNKKAISVKLNSRDLQELQMETLTLSQQNTHMEEKLLQLRRTMSREKEQRGHSGGFRWKSSQGGSAAANTKKDRDDKLQKLSAGKVKIRVLKDEPMTILPQPPAQPVGPNRTRRSRLRGVVCGQCEVRSAGLKCAECSENFCVPCFVKFHQKGALKLHRMIPIKTELQTAVSTQEVVGVNPSISSKPGDLSPEGGEAAKSPHVHFHPDQVSGCSLSEEENKRSPPSLLRGDFDEEESTKSFQEALRQWRGGQTNGTADPGNDAAWTPAGPGSVSATATQADLSEDEEAEGGGRGRGRGTVPVRVEFTPNHSYMDRLLLKKHRRTPVELYKSYLSWMLELKFLPEENSVEEKEETRKVEVEEQVELSLTAQEEEFHRYYASLFAVPVSGGSTEAPVRSPGHHLVVEVLDELDGDGNHGNSEDQTETNAATKLDFSEPSSSANTTPGSTTAPPTVGSSGRSSTVHSPSQLQPETTDKLRPPGPPTAGAGGLMKTSASRTVTSPHGAVRSPRTTSQENLRSSARVCRSDCFSSSKLMSSSPRPQDQIRPNSQRPQSCCPSPEPNQRRWSSSSTRPSLRSTFTISPFSSAQSPLLPRVHTPTACPSDRCLSNTSSLLSFPRSPEPPLLQTPPPNSQLTAALTPASSPTTSLFNESPSDASLRRTSTTTDGGAAPPASSTSGGHDLTEHGTAPITAPPSPPPSPTPSPPSSPPLNMKQEEELLIDSEDEMSCDSLGLAFHEEDSSEEEEEDEETPGRSPRATNQPPSDEKVKGRHSDEPQQLSHGSTLIQGWSDGSEPQQFWDVRDRSPRCPDPSPGSSDETRHTPSAPKWMCSPSPAVSCPLVSSPLPASKLSSSCCCCSSSPPPPPPPPPAPGLPPLESDSELLPSFRPLSRAALEIMEICSVDQTGCEDPDLDNETTAYHLHNLEQELQRVTKDTGTRIMLPAERAAPSGKLPRVPVTEEQREEEEAAQMDRQSVLLLP